MRKVQFFRQLFGQIHQGGMEGRKNLVDNVEGGGRRQRSPEGGAGVGATRGWTKSPREVAHT
jgi:hypothetical protein